MHPDVRPIEALVPRKAAAFGGKARGLATLVRAGFAVPAGFAISSSVPEEAMARALPARDRIGALLTAPAREVGADRLESIAAAVRALPIAKNAEDAIRDAYRGLVRDGASAVAVRSSALHEDQAQRSGAGLYETVLGVTSEDALIDAIRAVWASAVSPRVITYLRALGVRAEGERGGGVGVVVQALVPADVSGVMFTVNPLSGDTQEIVVNAAYGLGSAVVDGRVSPDTYRIDKSSGWVRDKIVGEKMLATRLVDGALRDDDVSESERAREALPEGRVQELAVLAQRIEQTFGDARDVEWALAGNAIFVLQARPVTALPGTPKRARVRRVRDRSRIVWSNVNVGEALPGVATPLTWSILSGFSDVGFRRAFGALGCSVPADAELVGNFRGRIYLNLSEFFTIASQVPGISPRMILALGGGGELAGERFEADPDGPSPLGFVARLPLTTARFVRENFQITRRVEAFEVSFTTDLERLRAIDLRLLSSVAVHRRLFEVERLLDQSGQVLLNVYGNLLATVVALRTVVGVFAGDATRADAFFRELLSGLLDIDSAGPGLELTRIAETARRDPDARAYLLDGAPERMRVNDVPAGPTRGLLTRFFEIYGDRGTREAEIAEPRWREDPTLPFATLRLHLQRAESGEHAPTDVERRQREIRERAQGELERLVPVPARFAVRRLLELVQRFLRMREKLRGHVVSVLGLFREVALDASRRMRAMEPGVGEDGAFYLSLGELHGVLRGDVPTVGDLVRARRLQLQRDAALPAPPDTFVGFPPPLAPPDPATSVLHGLGACAGRIVSTVRLVNDPSDLARFEAGEILLAQQTDVGWSPLFLVAGGVITELGGPLSHASIVAREFGIPAVVNVKRATSVLKTGDRVELDGERGTVRLIERG